MCIRDSLKGVTFRYTDNQGHEADGSPLCFFSILYLVSYTHLQLPAKLPKLIKLLTSKVPADFKAAVAMAVFPPLAAHLKGVTFRYKMCIRDRV